jgi:hypothetical protein
VSSSGRFSFSGRTLLHGVVNYVIVINDFMFDLIGIHDFMFDVVTLIGTGNSSAIYTLKSMKIFPFRIWTHKLATFGFIATFRSSAEWSSSVVPQLIAGLYFLPYCSPPVQVFTSCCWRCPRAELQSTALAGFHSYVATVWCTPSFPAALQPVAGLTHLLR